MFRPFKIIITAILIGLCPCQVQAQKNINYKGKDINDPLSMITDRPDATESPNTVEPGYVQIETGSYYTRYESKDVLEESVGYNTILARIGLIKNLELRLGVNYENNIVTTRLGETQVKTNFYSLSPMLAGMKINLFEGRKIGLGDGSVDFALLGQLYLPFTVSKNERIIPNDPKKTGADLRFSVGHEISDSCNLSYNLGARWPVNESGIAFIYTLSYGYSLNDKMLTYIEVYGDTPKFFSANHYWDTGLTYLARLYLQYDLSFGQSITDGQDLLLSAGLTYKFAH